MPSPGHGKIWVADYLVGSRGTVRHAVALGAIVTFRHTASVIVIALIAPFASHWIMPDALGIMIIAVGLNRIMLGLAAVLLAIGILLGSAALPARALRQRSQQPLEPQAPLGSAAIVTVLGIGITFGGFAAYLH